MEVQYVILIVYLVIINITAFIAFGMDKRKAKKGRWRIPERTLMMLAVLGGTLGALLGMYGFRHKTRHLKFVLGVPLILAVQAGVLGYFFLF